MASVTVLEKLSKAADDKTSKETLLEMLGDLSGFELLMNQLLVAIYVGGQYIPGTKILQSSQQLKEYIWQGTAGLVVKKGPIAFDPDGMPKGSRVDIGEWVVFQPGDGKRIQIRGVDCRVFTDENIWMKTKNPEVITHRN